MNRSWLKARLDNPWKRSAFVLLMIAAGVLLAIVLLPPPVEVHSEEYWTDTPTQVEGSRKVLRVSSRCAEMAFGGSAFAHEYWTVNAVASNDDPYVRPVTEVVLATKSRPHFIDITDTDVAKTEAQLATSQNNCVKGYCATQLTLESFRLILQMCATPVLQVRSVVSSLGWDPSFEARVPIVISLLALIATLALFSVFYNSTVGRLVAWVRNG